MKIRSYLIVCIGGLITTIVIGSSLLFYSLTKKILCENLDNVLLLKSADMAAEVVEQVEETMSKKDVAEKEPDSEFDYSGVSDMLGKSILTGTFNIAVTTHRRRLYEFEYNTDMSAFKLTDFPVIDTGVIFFNIYSETERVRFVGQNVIVADTAFFVYIGHSLSQIDKTLSSIAVFLTTAMPVIFLLTILVMLVIIKKGFSPLYNIIEKIKEINIDVLGFRLEQSGKPNEIGELAHVFNRMLERIDNSVKKMRQFTSDVSHEIRTPVSVIKSQAQIILRKERTDREYKEALHTIEEESAYLEKMVEELLLLTRLDNHTVEEHMDAVNLYDFFNEQAVQYKSFADITIDCEREISLAVNETLFELIFRNLFSNSLKFGEGDIHIAISASREDGRVIIRYADDGCAVSEEVLPNLFDRFFQADSSRSGQKGIGLGLNIVKSIVTLHNGRIIVTGNRPKGLEFTMSFQAVLF